MIDFSKDGYKKLLSSISENYRICSVSDAFQFLAQDVLNQICMLRHDVDYDLSYAVSMAKIEKHQNVRSTYFILFDSENYNALSKASIKAIREISNLGHELSLHFDCSCYEEHEHRAIINQHVNLLSSITNQKVLSISFHNPSIYQKSVNQDEYYHGLYSMYSEKINSIFHYASDSLCRFRDITILEKIRNKKIKNLHLLIHPIWWINEEVERDRKMNSFFDYKQSMLVKDYQDIITRSNI